MAQFTFNRPNDTKNGGSFRIGSPIMHDDVLKQLQCQVPALIVDGDDEELLPGSSVVGCGYNVLTGYYGNVRSCLSNLFDLDKGGMERVYVGGKSFSKPKVLTMYPQYGTRTYIYSGQTIEEYNTSISSKTQLEGSYSFFSASITADIGMDHARSLDRAFSKVISDAELFTLQLPPHHDKFLKPEAKEDIDTMQDLDKLFDMYGTHYLAAVIMGGHATYSSSTIKSKFSSKLELGLVANMAFKATLGSLSASEEAKYKTDIESFNESSSISIQTSGGDPGLGGPDLPKHVQDWLKSVQDYMTLADFLDGGVVGIWNLASADYRRTQLRNHYHDYCQRKQMTFSGDGPALQVKVVPVTKIFTPWFTAGMPDIGGGWSSLGQIVGGYGDTFVVRETEPGSGILAAIARWEKIVSFGSYSIWRGVAANPVDYVVMSDFCRLGDGTPTSEETAGLKAVHKSCVVQETIEWKSNNDCANCWSIHPVDTPLAASLIDLRHFYVVMQGIPNTTIVRQVSHLKGPVLKVV